MTDYELPIILTGMTVWLVFLTVHVVTQATQMRLDMLRLAEFQQRLVEIVRCINAGSK